MTVQKVSEYCYKMAFGFRDNLYPICNASIGFAAGTFTRFGHVVDLVNVKRLLRDEQRHVNHAPPSVASLQVVYVSRLGRTSSIISCYDKKFPALKVFETSLNGWVYLNGKEAFSTVSQLSRHL